MSIVKVTFSLLLLLILSPMFFILPINGSGDYNGIIHGNVRGFQINKFENISDAEISVFKDDELISKTLSNFSGEYFFELSPRAYKIRASAEGFAENTVNVIIDPISNQTIDFFLLICFSYFFNYLFTLQILINDLKKKYEKSSLASYSCYIS